MIDIYKIENLLNGMVYIGQTKRGIKKRFSEHCNSNSYLGRAISKYGKENFEISIIEKVDDSLANDAEHKNILKYNCVIPNGYNMNEYGRLVDIGVSPQWYIGMTPKIHNIFYNSIDKTDLILCGYFQKLLLLSNKDFILMKNHKTPFKTWAEIYKAIGVSHKSTQSKFKKFCEKHDLVRKVKEYKNTEDKKKITMYILNEELFQIIY